ncbi:MAG: DUF934 domain-containing protein [Gammaproteobacteria bacterium]|nr:MAG: DUF934 domain-containing protein [Gammaproteobacteria bacterium]UCH39786.1 MAG: DUF934 domain-containing protein [Gammaproteobacteria bacterium]
MTRSISKPKKPAQKQLRLSWQEWLKVHAVVTSPSPDGRTYEVSVVITTDLPVDHPQLSSLLAVEKIVIEIETFTDGRVFSLARLLRDEVGFNGDLEVSGDFLPDQISFLQRCGVNSFSGEDIIRDAFNYYSGFYQPPRTGIDEVTFIRESRAESG